MRTTVTILGSGTSSGVPFIHCKCKVCRSKNPKNKRSRASIWVKKGKTSVLIDVSPDFKAQVMRAKVPHIDTVLLTHPHFDHMAGIDELRSYNYIQKGPIPIYGNAWTMRELHRRFHYLFDEKPWKGGGLAQLAPHKIEKHTKKIKIKSLSCQPIWYRHGKQFTLGYRFDDIAYIPDCSYIPPASIDQLRGLRVLILDCLQIKGHSTHLNLDQALDIAKQLAPKKTILTHLGHDFDYEAWNSRNKRLPKGICMAYDGLTLSTT